MSRKLGAKPVNQRRTNTFYKIHFDSTGNYSVFTQQIGDPDVQGGLGQSVFSPDGTLFARYVPQVGLYLYDFDRESGNLSQFRKIMVEDSGNIGGIAISPNSRFLYTSSLWDVYQFDLTSNDIQSSKIHLGHYDGFLSPFPTVFYQMQLGPDCRIYMIPNNGVDVMHVIHLPDLPGHACNFEQHGIHLPEYNSITIPNFPVARLDGHPPCDPDILLVGDDAPVQEAKLEIYPNPSNGEVYVKGMNDGTPYSIYNVIGQLVQTGYSDFDRIDVRSQGMLFLSLQTEKRIVVLKFLVAGN